MDPNKLTKSQLKTFMEKKHIPLPTSGSGKNNSVLKKDLIDAAKNTKSSSSDIYKLKLLNNLLENDELGDVIGKALYYLINDADSIDEVYFYVKMADDEDIKYTIAGIPFDFNVIKSVLVNSNTDNIITNYKKIENFVDPQEILNSADYNWFEDEYGDIGIMLMQYIKDK